MPETDTTAHGPRLLALLTCRRIETEDGGHDTPVQIFERIVCSAFPALGTVGVYARYVDGPPSSFLKIEIVHLRTGDVLVTADGVGEGLNRIDPVVTSETFQVRLPEAGDYQVRFFVDGKLLGFTDFRAEVTPWTRAR